MSRARIDLPGLEAFLSVAHWGSFRRAAGHLNLSQAALSHRLKKLEDDLGVPLLARTTRQVGLTPAGAELLPTAQKLVGEMASALDGLRERAKTRQERIAIGSLPTIALLHVPSVLREFRRRQPQIFVQVYDNSAGEIAQRVRSGDAAFGVTIVSADTWDLEIAPVTKDPFVVVCPLSHPLAGQSSIPWPALEGESLIRISAEAANRALIDEALGSRRESMRWQLEVQHVSTAISLVREGLGLAVVPRIGFEAAGCNNTRGIPLRHPSVSRSLGIISRRDRPLTPAASLLRDMFRERLFRG